MQLNGLPMSKSAYSKIESNKQHIKISELCLLKQYFKVSYDDFFEGFENKKSKASSTELQANIGAPHETT